MLHGKDDVITVQWMEIPIAPVWFSALTEAERSKSVEAGSLINLQCEIADQTGQSSRCEDGIKVSQYLGTNIDSEDDKWTLAVMSATSSSSGVYSCKTDDDSDSNDFYVEVKGDILSFF